MHRETFMNIAKKMANFFDENELNHRRITRTAKICFESSNFIASYYEIYRIATENNLPIRDVDLAYTAFWLFIDRDSFEHPLSHFIDVICDDPEHFALFLGCYLTINKLLELNGVNKDSDAVRHKIEELHYIFTCFKDGISSKLEECSRKVLKNIDDSDDELIEKNRKLEEDLIKSIKMEESADTDDEKNKPLTKEERKEMKATLNEMKESNRDALEFIGKLDERMEKDNREYEEKLTKLAEKNNNIAMDILEKKEKKKEAELAEVVKEKGLLSRLFKK